MGNKINVLIIEDDQTRVEWLRETFNKQFNILWHTSVNDFVRDYSIIGIAWDLVIFDYDLTPDYGMPIFDESKGLWLVPTVESVVYNPYDKDKDNLNGLDAANLLPEANKYTKDTKFLVWSANPNGAPLICKKLKEKGYTRIVQECFDFYTKQRMKNKIQQLLEI